MIDPETRESLISVCQSLKAQYKYLLSLQGRLVWLDHAIKKAVPEVSGYTEQVPYQAHPEAERQIELIDELLGQLGKQKT